VADEAAAAAGMQQRTAVIVSACGLRMQGLELSESKRKQLPGSESTSCASI
jgi:hypothetical protein